jgi:hypothetical protein
MNIYRKIWEQHNGSIPKDEEGRSYEIHHIDGNRSNNHIDNLICVSVQEHYNIHHRQKNWAACLLISERMNISVEEKTKLAKRHVKKQLQENKHPWKTEEYRKSQKARALSDNNPFKGGKIQKVFGQKRVSEGIHHFLGSSVNQKMLAESKHPSQILWKCEHCNKEGKNSTNYKRFHGQNCKFKV